MLTCEICGKPIRGKPFVIMIGGAKLTVCNECSRYGTPVKVTKPIQQISSTTYVKPKIQISTINKPSQIPLQKRPENKIFDEDVKVVDNYASLIKSARERL